ncbi:protein ITPRID2 isoform X2 [Amia ocellicauda]|uniref:protein ITPRID2 isoform X2 n=1 Tax=Amia ocellicauda TaxID=2972642 RepID=UPI0034646E96
MGCHLAIDNIGVLKNGCSFEDDLSLGAEANHLHPSSNKTETPCFGMLAKDKRSQFQQKGRSMNSTGSGKSSTTYSSVSELLDLYEEDPEEVLYNLGFGTDEPDIASKIPSRFFNATSSAKGIDIKVYLGAQLQRMELENPNYALTSRFRQIEVLTTVANAFSSLYSQVSGLPVQKIGSVDVEGKEVPPLKRSTSALNAAKILRKNITKLNLHASSESTPSPVCTSTDKGAPAVSGTEEDSDDSDQKNEQKLQKLFKKKDSPSLATVTEEVQNSPADSSGVNQVLSSDSQNELGGNGVSEEVGLIEPSAFSKELSTSSDGDLEDCDEQKQTVTSSPNQEPSAPLQNPRFAHLSLQQKDSFEFEEVQSNEGESIPGTHSSSRGGNDPLLRTESQHSDSSGFAEDPSADGSSNYLKVQESCDSCDSETTVTSTAADLATPVALDHPAFQELQGGEDLLPDTVVDGADPLDMEALSTSPTESACEEPPPEYVLHQIPKPLECVPPHPAELPSAPESEAAPNPPSASDKVKVALRRAQSKACTLTDQRPRIKAIDLLHSEMEERFPLRRSQSLPSSLLSPSRVVSSVKIRLRPGRESKCGPPSFTYHYTPEEDVESICEEEEHSPCKSTLIISQPPKAVEQEDSRRDEEDGPSRGPPYPLHLPPHLTQSTYSLHSCPADWQDRPLCDHMSAWSTCSIPNLAAHSTCSSSYSYRSCPYAYGPVASPPQPIHTPSTTEMQLRRVLHDIRSTVQNLSQYSAVRGDDLSTSSMFNPQRSILPLYENTIQELQIMRKSLNVFRTQMMDLELSMMRQQSMVYQHLTEEERLEAQQLQHLRNAVRQELQELELQLEDRLLSLDEQMRSSHPGSLYRHPTGLHGTRSMDCLSCHSPMNVIEPVTELLREQLYLKSELGFEESGGDGYSSNAPSVASGRSSGSASPVRTSKSTGTPSHRPQTPDSSSWQRGGRYKASVVLTPTPPVRPGTEKTSHEEQDQASNASENSLRDDFSSGAAASEESGRRAGPDNPQLQQLIKEIKDSIADEIRQEIVNELLAAVSSRRSPVIKREHMP